MLTVAFFVDDSSKVDFYLYDPKNNVVDKVKKRSYYFFQFEAKEQGTYKFTFTNDKVVLL
jgi:hypothetical protein